MQNITVTGLAGNSFSFPETLKYKSHVNDYGTTVNALLPVQITFFSGDVQDHALLATIIFTLPQIFPTDIVCC